MMKKLPAEAILGERATSVPQRGETLPLRCARCRKDSFWFCYDAGDPCARLVCQECGAIQIVWIDRTGIPTRECVETDSGVERRTRLARERMRRWRARQLWQAANPDAVQEKGE
jgi:hypothetical protein